MVFKYMKVVLVFCFLSLFIGSVYSSASENEDCGYYPSLENYNELKYLQEIGKFEIIKPSKRSLEYKLPSKCDISLDKAFPPIGKQKGPVCASYSSCYYNASYLIAKRDGLDLSSDSSNAMSPYYVYGMVEQSGSGIGGTSLYSPMHAMVSHGCLTYKEWPMSLNNYHRRWNVDSDLWRKALKRRMKKSFLISGADTPEGVNEIKRCLLDTTMVITVGGPDTKRGFEMRPLKSNPNAPENSKYPGETGCIWSSMGLGGHAMALVGYNDNIWLDVNDNNKIDDGEMGAWKIANSYGEEFPEIPSNKGYHWVSYDATRKESKVAGLNTGDDERVSVFLGNKVEGFQIMEKGYEPKVLAEITLHSAGRMDPRITFFKTNQSDTPPFNITNSWKEYLFGTKSGSQKNRIGFDAENYDDNPDDAPEGTFMFDLTEHVPNSPTQSWRLGVSIQDKYAEKPTTIKSLKVIYLLSNSEVIFECKKLPGSFDNDTKNMWVDVPGDATALYSNDQLAGSKKIINYANNGGDKIDFNLSLTNGKPFEFSIYDISGRRLFHKSYGAGSLDRQCVQWDQSSRVGRQTLIAVIKQGSVTVTQRLLLLK